MTAGVFVIAVLLLACAIAGALLLALGLRGRRISTNPHCRMCRFDLVGLAIDAPDSRCPECGGSLHEPRAVRAGLRKRRPVVAAVGAVVLLVPLAIVGIALAASVRNNVHALKPDFWLMIEARNASPAAITPQLGELLARMQADTLSAGNRDGLIVRALEVQADDTGGWDTAWGNILDFAAANSLLTEKQLKQNMRNAPRWDVVFRPTIVQGDDWVFGLLSTGGRVGSTPFGRAPLRFRRQIESMRVGPQVIVHVPEHIDQFTDIHARIGSVTTTRRPIPGVVPGEHEVKIIWRVTVGSGNDATPVTTWTEERISSITILPEGSTGVELVDDPGIREDVLKSLSIRTGIRVENAPGTPREHIQLGFTVWCDSPPLDLAFDVIVRERLADDVLTGAKPREWKVGGVSFTRSGPQGYGGQAVAAGFDATAADIVLRPSVHAAKSTLGIDKIWNGEVVFRNVPIDNTDPRPNSGAGQSLTLLVHCASERAVRPSSSDDPYNPNAKPGPESPPLDRAVMTPLPRAESP